MSYLVNLLLHVLDFWINKLRIVSDYLKKTSNAESKDIFEEEFGDKDVIVFELFDHTSIKLFKQDILSDYIIRGFEKSEVSFIRRFLKPEDAFFDVGANIGYYTVLAGEVLDDSSKIHSFEPSPETFLKLRENCRLNGLEATFLNQLALSDYEGTSVFFDSVDGQSVFNSLAEPSLGKEFSQISVHVTTLDKYVEAAGIEAGQLSLIKIDVEGFEFSVIEGGRGLLARENSPTLIVEFTERNFLKNGYSGTDVYSLLVELGYMLYYYNMEANSLVALGNPIGFEHINVIATKDHAKVISRLNR